MSVTKITGSSHIWLLVALPAPVLAAVSLLLQRPLLLLPQGLIWAGCRPLHHADVTSQSLPLRDTSIIQSCQAIEGAGSCVSMCSPSTCSLLKCRPAVR